jgi:hypothetical protein
MGKRRQTVDQWVETVVTDVIDGRPCSAVACLHLKGIGGATEEVTTKPLEGGPINVKELADHLVGRAEGFGQELPGLQTFKLLAFYGTSEPHNPFHFTVSDGSVISRTEAMQTAHEPTPTGLLGQLMKHNEALVQRNMELTQSNMQMAQGIIGMCLGPGGIIAQSRQTELEAIAVVKDASLSMFEQRRKLRIDELQAAQELQTRKAITDAIPHIVNRISGHEVFSETGNKAAILDKLALKVTPEDLEMLVAMKKLTKEEALVLSAQFAAIVEEKRKELEALKATPTEDGEPHNVGQSSEDRLTYPGTNGKGEL